ncbi:MAG: hypothetical protein C4320_06450 [Armatimonadota bacterium]
MLTILCAIALFPQRQAVQVTPRRTPIVGRWYRETADGKVAETLQLEGKGAVAYTRESGGSRVKSYGTWRRSGNSALVVKLPFKDLRRNDEKGFILRIESGRLVPATGEAWVRARRVR